VEQMTEYNYLEKEVSYFTNIHSKQNSIYTIQQVIDVIRNENFKNEIDRIRNEQDKKKRDGLKKMLPAITVSAIFNGQRLKDNFVSHSGLMQIDLDNLEDLNFTREQVINDEFSFAVFNSPSNMGLKILVKIPANIQLHEKHFLHLEKYYLLNYGISIDKSCKDITRLMFLTADKSIYVNENSKEFTLSILSTQDIIFTDAVNRINTKKEFKNGNRNNYVFYLACECKRMHLDEQYCQQYCTRLYFNPDFETDEILRTIKSAYGSSGATIEPPGKKVNPSLSSLLIVKTANECIEEAKTKAIPNMLFGEFFHEHELCILFADTNVGKSILAVQIANSISKGEQIAGFKLEAEKQNVCLLDFELSEKQFQKRYSDNYINDYVFSDGLFRSEINSDYTNYVDFEQALFESLERNIVRHGFKVLIVDNITYLKTQSTETAKDALPLMKRLRDLQKKYELSMLILAHTPKRNAANPISINDLAGSKHLANFADSIFSIGASAKDGRVRYIKQIKARATEKIYDYENVVVCTVEKPSNFLQFTFLDFGSEKEHLKVYDNKEIEQSIFDLRTTNPDISEREIARQLQINAMKVNRVLKKKL
jgi:VirE N-terminal domain/AAA domain/Primase C terminal 1 (PriCT-1)